MSKQKLNIVEVVTRSGFAKRTGNPWMIHEAQCILEQETEKGRELLVGTINLDDKLKEARGEFIAEFAMFRTMDGKLEARVVALVALGAQKPTAKPGAGALAASSAA